MNMCLINKLIFRGYKSIYRQLIICEIWKKNRIPSTINYITIVIFSINKVSHFIYI